MFYPFTVVNTVDTFVANWVEKEGSLWYQQGLEHGENQGLFVDGDDGGGEDGEDGGGEDREDGGDSDSELSGSYLKHFQFLQFGGIFYNLKYLKSDIFDDFNIAE